jgi:hypothetical protein
MPAKYGCREMGLFRRSAPFDPTEIDRMKAEVTALRDELTTLDDRVTSVSTELANQLTELGHDIDALADRPTHDGVDGAELSAVQAGQVRLANEQARYQIAFREDLAQLAQELKRPR